MMEDLGTVLRTVCLGLCACGLGIGFVVAVFLGITGNGIVGVIKDILGVGQRDEDKLIDETMESIQEKRATLKRKRAKIIGDGGIPDFEASVAQYAQQSDSDDPGRRPGDLDLDLDQLGSGRRFDNSSEGLRGKKRGRNNDEYEIYDDYDVFDD